MFTGFPEAALDFYDDLEMDNSRTFFQAHRHIYDTAVLAPMRALTDLLADEFGPAKIYRPHRDLRFSKDKSPYKTHQGAVVPTAPSAGYYVEVSAAGVRVAGGFYHAEPDRLAALRTAIDHELYGPELERIVAALTADGFVLGGDRLKTAPRGYPRDHPRIALLRHRSLTATFDYGFAPLVHTAALADRVRAHWRALTPLQEWITRHGAH